MHKTFELNIQGYYRDEVRNQFPNKQGVYFVYKGILNYVTRTCILTTLLFIGETEDLHSTFNEHPTRDQFIESIKEGESIFYAYALTDFRQSNLRRVAASLIYELQPLLNNRGVDACTFPSTTIKILGNRHAFIPEIVTAPSY